MEIAGVVIPDLSADLLYGEPRLPQQTRRFVQPLVQQKLLEGASRGTLHFRTQIRQTHMKCSRHIGEARRTVVLFDFPQRGLHHRLRTLPFRDMSMHSV